VFVGGVKRNMKEVELEMIMDTLYRGVWYDGIENQNELK
jgi:hypothetical protein